MAEYLLVPGDPDRVPKLAKFWDQARELSSHREFCSYRGTYKGVPISALSSGIGPACMSIVVNEASKIGVNTFIRVGSTGAIQKDIACGDVIISTAAVRLDGTSDRYVMPGYPAVVNYEVLLALIEAAERLSICHYHVGIVATTSDFYAGQDRSMPKGCSVEAENLLPTLQRAGVLSLEMETATLYTLAGLYGLRAGAICAVYSNRCTNEFGAGKGEENAIRIANEAVKIMNEWDIVKKAKGRRWLFPTLIRSPNQRGP